MLAAERHDMIVELVREQGSVQVEELAETLGVSAMTIRRDLEKLQKRGVIDRCHGGAVAKNEENYAKKQIHHQSEKTALAKRCMELIQEGDCIFLDAGTTTYEIARLLKDREDLVVATNDLEIAFFLLKEGKPELIVCGGNVQRSTGSMWGNHAMQMMQNFVFDVGFFGAAMVNGQFQVLTPTVDKAFLKRTVAQHCQNAYLVVDDSKFSKQAMHYINELSDYTAVITNRKFTEQETLLLRKKHIKIRAVE